MLTKKFLNALNNFIDSERFKNIEIRDDIVINQDWGADSLDKAILEMYLEQEYQISIDPYDFIKKDFTLMSLEEMCEFCEEHSILQSNK